MSTLCFATQRCFYSLMLQLKASGLFLLSFAKGGKLRCRSEKQHLVSSRIVWKPVLLSALHRCENLKPLVLIFNENETFYSSNVQYL